MKDSLNKIKERGAKVGNEVREKTSGYIAAAFSLVAGLAWNDAAHALIENLFKIEKNTVIAKFVYAVFITLFVVFVTMIIIKKPKEEEKKEEKK